ncbi:MAG TPA: sigma-70 family RNA polymerase sigma factor [Patescibacteria group bacterium]|nr:sigma-70 family RNA polymerase sigma factor [Patescibacteria group bacterium]
MENNAKGLMDGKTVSQDKKAAISVNDVKNIRGRMNIESIFLRDMREFSVLTAEEEKELGILIQKYQDESAIHKLVLHNLRLARIAACKYLYSGVSFLDLVQMASLGLMEAAKRFDPSKNVRFATYAAYWITQHILRGIQNTEQIIRSPIYIGDKLKKLAKITGNYKAKYGRSPSDAELSEILFVSKKEIRELFSIMTRSLSYLDENYDPLGKGNADRNLHEVISDIAAPSPEDILIAKQELADITDNVKIILKALMKKSQPMDRRNKDIFIMRYGLDNGLEGRTLDYVGEKFCITKERVRQIIDKKWEVMRGRCLPDLLKKNWTRQQIYELNHDWMIKELLKIESLIEICGLTANLFTQELTKE